MPCNSRTEWSDNMSIVSLKDVEKYYGDNRVVRKLNMEIEEGEFLTLLGPSGCGKTTTLRMIAGFEDATSGSILVEGENVEEKEPYERNVNTVFQSYALFPHMNIFENIAYGLKIKKLPKDEIKQRVTEMLELVQLTGFEKRKPFQLSGGQKQRVAIARALINRPKVLLLDEPLGALDLKLRKQMQIELKRLQRKLKTTFVYVTHDQEEALTMSDRIAIMNSGRLEQLGTPKEIYEHPKTKFVAGFIGESNIIEGVCGAVTDNYMSVETECGIIRATVGDFKKGESLYLSIRPENVLFSPKKVDGFTVCGSVKDIIFVGSITKIIAALPNRQEIKISRLPNEEIPNVGDVVYLYWKETAGVLIKNMDNVVYQYLSDKQKEGMPYEDGQEKTEEK